MTKITRTPHERYNALPFVEDADARVRACADFDAVLDEAGLLLLDAGLHEKLAVRLLHRHNTITPHEAMVESFEVLPDGRPALSTVRTADPDARMRAPSVWDCLADGTIVPLEFTVECDDVRGYETAVSDKQQLFAAFNALMRRHSLEGVLGLSLTSRKLRAGEGQALVESIDERRVANVVVIEDGVDPASSDLLPTTWEFTGDVVMRCVKKFCQKLCRWDSLTQCHKKTGHEGIHTGG